MDKACKILLGGMYLAFLIVLALMTVGLSYEFFEYLTCMCRGTALEEFAERQLWSGFLIIVFIVVVLLTLAGIEILERI